MELTDEEIFSEGKLVGIVKNLTIPGRFSRGIADDIYAASDDYGFSIGIYLLGAIPPIIIDVGLVVAIYNGVSSLVS